MVDSKAITPLIQILHVPSSEQIVLQSQSFHYVRGSMVRTLRYRFLPETQPGHDTRQNRYLISDTAYHTEYLGYIRSHTYLTLLFLDVSQNNKLNTGLAESGPQVGYHASGAYVR